MIKVLIYVCRMFKLHAYKVWYCKLNILSYSPRTQNGHHAYKQDLISPCRIFVEEGSFVTFVLCIFPHSF